MNAAETLGGQYVSSGIMDAWDSASQEFVFPLRESLAYGPPGLQNRARKRRRWESTLLIILDLNLHKSTLASGARVAWFRKLAEMKLVLLPVLRPIDSVLAVSYKSDTDLRVTFFHLS